MGSLERRMVVCVIASALCASTYAAHTDHSRSDLVWDARHRQIVNSRKARRSFAINVMRYGEGRIDEEKSRIKPFCERAEAYCAQHHGLSVICLRIGRSQWPHDNQPGPHRVVRRWGRR